MKSEEKKTLLSALIFTNSKKTCKNQFIDEWPSCNWQNTQALKDITNILKPCFSLKTEIDTFDI